HVGAGALTRARLSGRRDSGATFAGFPNAFALFAKRRGLFPSHVGAGALTRPGGDFFRGVQQNLLSHTCPSEERRDENLPSNTCHSESALAVRNLLFAGGPGFFALFAHWGG